MKLELTPNEYEILIRLMDAGVKVVGLQAVTPELVSLREKLGAGLKKVMEDEQARAQAVEYIGVPDKKPNGELEMH